jgi:transposase-like protein
VGQGLVNRLDICTLTNAASCGHRCERPTCSVTPMTTGCSICQRADIQTINEALTHGEPVRALARRYGIPKTTLLRHKAQCFTTGGGPLPQRATSTELETHVAQLTTELAEVQTQLAQTQGQLAGVSRELTAWRTAQAAQQAHDAAGQVLVAQLRAWLRILHDDAPSWQLVHSLLRGDGRNGKGPLLQALRRLVGRPERSFYGME